MSALLRSISGVASRAVLASPCRTAPWRPERVLCRLCHHQVGQPPLDMLSEDEVLMKETVARFAKEEIQPLVKQMDVEAKMSLPLLKALFDNGLMGIDVPEEYGGTGSSFFTSCLAVEEVAKVDMGISLYVDIQNTLINNLLQKLGTPEQKQKYLPELVSEKLGSFCLSEPQSGSDAFALTTKAEKDGSHYVLNGSKCWISHASYAQVFLVMANANPSEGYRGITTFIVDGDSEGLTIGKSEDKMGLRSTVTCTVNFDDVRVPEENVLGEVGQGYKYAITMLNEGRVGIGAQLVGVAQGCLDNTLPYLIERRQFGRRIWDFQAMQHQVAHIHCQVTAARLMVYNAARRRDAGLPFLKEAAMAKYFAANVACETTSKCVEWMGGVGFTKDFPVEKYYRDSKIGTIYEGTNNILLNTIAKQMEHEI